MNDKYFDIKIGEKSEFKHKITQKNIEDFVKLTGDDNPLHTDEKFTATTNFKKPVVHGMLTASFVSTMIGKYLPGPGSLWVEQNYRFIKSVRVGEEIIIKAEVIGKSDAQRIIILKTEIFDSNNNLVISGKGKVKIIKSKKMEEKRMNLERKKYGIIITGATGGIGSAITEQLADDGFSVIINYRNNENKAKQLAEKINSKSKGKAVIFQADITDKSKVNDMVERCIKEFGNIYGIVNTVSMPINYVSINEVTWQNIIQQIEPQIKGSLNLIQSSLSYLLSQEKGCIVNIGSINTDGNPPLKMFPYNLAKTGLNMLTKSLAAELGVKGIRVNTVSPGMTDTDFIADMPEKSKIMYKMNTPLRKIAQPEDIAGAVSFLFSERARHITGINLKVCGGNNMF